MNEENNIILTIVTVCYNSEKTIGRCINSILPILDKKVEYIIIDGKSKDNTLAIINNYCKDKPHVSIISEPDRGIYDAMNKGVRYAQGEYILFINSDDALLPDGARTLLSFLRDNKQIDSVCADVVVVEFDSNNQEHEIKVWEANPNFPDLQDTMICSHQGFVSRTSDIRLLGGFDTNLKIAADWDLILRLYNKGSHFICFHTSIARFSRGGVSCEKEHILERHKVRKKNHCYSGFLDYKFYQDIKTAIHNFIFN